MRTNTRKFRLALSALTLVALVLSAFGAVPAWAQTNYYVSTTGNDGNDGTAPDDAHAWLTIQHAIDNVTAGDTINVAAGTYSTSTNGETFPITINESVTLLGAQANVDPRPSQGGRTGGESVIDAEENSNAVLQISADDVEINGFTITGGKKDMVEESSSANNLLFRYNILYDDLATAGDEAIQIKYSDGVVMEYNYAYDILQDAFNLSVSTNGVIRYNEAHDIYSENAAIYCYGSTGLEIRGNLIYNVPNNDGIKLGSAEKCEDAGMSSNSIITENIVHDTAEDGITVYTSDVIVEGNEIYNADSENGALYIDCSVSNITVRNNDIHDNDAIGLLIGEKGAAGASNVTVTGNDIYNNDDTNDTKYPGSAGIWIADSSDASTIAINCNNIYDNADYGLRNDDGSTVDAEDNWWDSANGPEDPAGSEDTEVPPCTGDPASEKNTEPAGQLGDKVSDDETHVVDYCPWYDALLEPSQSGVTATGTGEATFTSSAGFVRDFQAVAEADLPPEGKPDLVFPHGFFSFNICCLPPCQNETVTVTITLPSAVPVGTQYWKCQNGTWYQIPIGDDDGDNVITIQLTDGGTGDADGLCNGVILDPGGPGFVPVPVGGVMVPVSKFELLAPWVGLAALMAVAVAAVVIRRRA